MRTKPPAKPALKITTLHGVLKKVPFDLPFEKIKDHQRTKTQNINIYNIIHNVTNQQSFFQDSFVPAQQKHETFGLTKTFDRRAVKSKHDQALEKELADYKLEVESRFHKSDVNRNYVFPRMIDPDNNSEEPVPSAAAVPASIYHNIPESRQTRQHFKPVTHTKSEERKKLPEDISKQVQILLRPTVKMTRNSHKSSKISLYGTQRFETSGKIPSPASRVVRVQKLKQAYSNVSNSKAPRGENSHILTSMDSIKVGKQQKTHMRNKTMDNVSMDLKSLALKSGVKPVVRQKGRRVQDYFKELINQRARDSKAGSRSIEKAKANIKHRSNLSGIFNSTATLKMNMTMYGGRGGIGKMKGGLNF
eukprot:TRINITY_DN1594_c0_g1_i1.p1 TRINITY_DN1594_c0_g1~~TRINITY_DN1594_c0_g1_i1.p1  ORF type:complete len:397 (+),score=24.35 TRINITY_DN1594_c0_g1_i1:106-1191(+)